MNLARHSITATNPVQLFNVQFDADCNVFTTTTPAGFAVYRSCPLELIRKREVTGGTLAAAVPLHSSSLLFLLGGGRSPRYPPNKVILWDEPSGQEVAELEFREKVRGVACRRGWLAVALRRRVVAFEVGEVVTRYGEWDTCDNPKGLLAIATGAYATLLAVPGRQTGHVQLIHLPPCRPPEPVGPPPDTSPSSYSRPSGSKAKAKTKPPSQHVPTKLPHSIIVAHNTALTTLSVPPSGRLLATTSLRGTLVRIWDTATGKQLREFRRGSDQAEIYGVAFRPDETQICVWSDKGTIHVFALSNVGPGTSNRQSTLSSLTSYLPLPRYFDSEWSYAQFRIPTQSAHISLSQQTSPRQPSETDTEEEKCAVGWIVHHTTPDGGVASGSGAVEHQLIALTYTGGWYRLSLPNASTASSSSTPSGASLSSSPSSASRPLSPPSIRSMHTPRPRSTSGSSFTTRADKGKGREGEKEKKESRDCVLQEFRRFGRWDGWG
ncbi:uncharacterized protein STEHIDRAFT_95773 [Stereum hirsutum FP-91666 SS1]|uniref:uncharacterized protein n=1 Tax=Stereum hirsutum (strain FP-91666) TaxID=721885 RepID=UPI000440FEDD|nr:uncharacterized protein STEHIDRAFT_95773 [Stereum hirsutum FP-91666 SS1]EIM88515.1 hypothetical protein STEHIDRAFT_95773 [Stereum hirsutum FP-91666 SS1]